MADSFVFFSKNCLEYFASLVHITDTKSVLLSIQFEPIQFQDMFQNKYSTLDPFQESLWVVFCRLVAFHPTLLYSQFNLVASNLLHVWILASSCPYSDHYLFRDHNSFVLFPFGCRGLQLVVAIIHDLWIHCYLFLYLCRSLLFLKADVGGRCFYNSVFWIHDNYDDICVSIHRFNRFLCMLLVCS